ncbi:MAG: phosphate ABC transporter permease PstA [Planctomycetes bacterium]|nr:phosphate ABC transporter permease PstA [Planctomycetota bacterium]MBL7008533.1 phosphate ABC transporter permease PstA [Planctomycetota bacterium]
MVLLFTLLLMRGAGAFWPRDLVEWKMADGAVYLVEEIETQADGAIRARLANRELYDLDFKIARPEDILSRSIPADALRLERSENGPFHGYLVSEGEQSWRLRAPDGAEIELPAAEVLRKSYPNQMGLLQRLGAWFAGVARFVTDEPRNANQEGGVWPALVGTSLLVILMSILVVPFGVMAALYLNEYARDTWFVRLVRVAVNNLAGVPSIVYGVFGLGFLVYGVGGALDHAFFSDSLPSPTFGAGGVLWASVTMALLTVPVVVVATEEGLRAVPRERREAALALGATRWEMLRHVILPGARPGILTGTILAVSRAAGEVAPLMLTGVVGFARELPVSGEFPYLHLNERFMHLGFHIYSVGFQAPNVEAAEPLVYATSALLLALVLLLNLTAIRLRARVRRSLAGK